jgi:hypothetical protein
MPYLLIVSGQPIDLLQARTLVYCESSSTRVPSLSQPLANEKTMIICGSASIGDGKNFTSRESGESSFFVVGSMSLPHAGYFSIFLLA